MSTDLSGLPTPNSEEPYNLAFLSPRDAQDGVPLLQVALDAARAVSDSKLEGLVLHAWGDAHYADGNFAEAVEKLSRAASLLETCGARPQLARVYVSLGRVLRIHGQFDRAGASYRAALKIQEETGDRQGVIQSTDALGLLAAERKEFRQALEYQNRALALARQTGSPRLIAHQLSHLAARQMDVGEPEKAAALLEEAIRQDPPGTAIDHIFLSTARQAMGLTELAFDSAGRAVQIARRDRFAQLLPIALYQHARVALQLGKTPEAISGLREAIQASERIRAHLVPDDLLKQGYAARRQSLFALAVRTFFQYGDPAEALETAERARSRAFLDLLATRELEPEASPYPAALQLSKRSVRNTQYAAPLALPQMRETAARLGATLLVYGPTTRRCSSGW